MTPPQSLHLRRLDAVLQQLGIKPELLEVRNREVQQLAQAICHPFGDQRLPSGKKVKLQYLIIAVFRVKKSIHNAWSLISVSAKNLPVNMSHN
jgi:prophage tail gpP-like protein